MMKWNDEIKEQLSQYVSTPAVLMSADEEPYEYRQTNGSVNRLKRRRAADLDVPLQLFAFVLENNISLNQLREFGSGLFMNYIETTKIYV